MPEAESIRPVRERLIHRFAMARRTGATEAAQTILRELINLHVRLGERHIGTTDEQRTYLLARSTRTPLPELQAIGIDTNQWPPPRRYDSAPSEPLPAAPDTEERISHLFAAAGPLSDQRSPRPRFEARYRPEDGQRYRGEPLPWAIWDTTLDQPVAYHPDKELAEYQADNATDRVRKRGLPPRDA